MASRKRSQSETYSGPSTSSQTRSDPDQMSMKSDVSKMTPINFGIEDFDGSQTRSDSDQMSMKSDVSKMTPINFGIEKPADEPRGKRMKTIQQDTKTEKVDGESIPSKAKQRLQRAVREKNTMVFEGDGDQKSSLKSIYTQLYITTGGSEALRDEHESRQLRAQLEDQSNCDYSVDLNDLFKMIPGQEKQHRTVLTKGVAGIGKSFTVQKFLLDWATEEAHQDVDFIFSFAFRELNLCSGEKSLHELLTEFHPDVLDLAGLANRVYSKMILILDGLDESRLPLAFKGSEVVTSVDQKTSVGNLMVNLIKGHLLPDAKLWITSRPTAADKIPVEHVGVMTEIRGFNEPQIEEYFNRRFASDSDLARRITLHIRSSQNLSIMCQIPIFCWISALLFQEVFKDDQTEVPQTLTEMMAHFLFAQTKRRMNKHGRRPAKTDGNFLVWQKDFILKLGKLAFEQLLKNSLIFYEKDLEDHGIDMKEVSEFCNSVFLEEKIIYQKKVFFFVHLTVQEFFAALYIYDSFINGDTAELGDFLQMKSKEHTLLDLLKTTADRALEKAHGHMDYFMQFLLGLLVEPNRRVLRGLLKPPDPSQDIEKKILSHLKSIRRKNISPDGCINVFQTMVEMRDHKVKDEIEEFLKERDPSQTELSPLQCSALAYMLQVSKNDLEVLDLNSYKTSEEGRRRLIPAVRQSRTALLANCGVSMQWVEHLAFGLRFPHSPLRRLDLSNNDLKDSGVKVLCHGLSSRCCRLESLSLSGCMVTVEGCKDLASALRFNQSHLRELDLSYNNPEESGINVLEDMKLPEFKLRHDHGSPQRMKPGLKKYLCDVTLDPSKLTQDMKLSDGNRKVSWLAEQVLTAGGPTSGVCRSQQSLKERCYLEAELLENCSVELAYRGDEESWRFTVEDGRYYIDGGGGREEVALPNWRSRRLGVYLDWEAGVLSFYRVSSERLTCLHTFRVEFREALRPVVRLQPRASVTFSSPP
ncbi:unnamed protein product [Ophioblennius macclurei]